METARVFWSGLRGRNVLNFNWAAINADSVVVVAASEYARNAAQADQSPRFIGEAPIRVSNVRPHGPPGDANNGVTFVVNVDWDEPLDVVTDIVIMGQAPSVIEADDLRTDVIRPFGYRRLVDGSGGQQDWDGNQRLSSRPAVLFVAHQQGKPPIAHTDAYYETFYFDITDANSLAGVFEEWRAAPKRLLPGPLPHISISAADLLLAANKDTMHLYVANVLEKLVRQVGTQPFRALDASSDADGAIRNREILFICVDSGSNTSGMNRHGRYTHPDGFLIESDVAFISHESGLMTACHELLHSWGGVDIYGTGGFNSGLSLLAVTDSGVPDDRNFALPDPWHRMAWGLTRPKAIDIDAAPTGEVFLDAATFGRDWPAVLFWDSSRGSRDCFLVELRTQMMRNGRRTLDRGVPQGFVVWQVSVNQDRLPYDVSAVGAKGADKSVNSQGKPSLQRGSIATWASGDTTPPLTWIDQTPSTLRLSFKLNKDRVSGSVSW